MWEQLTYTLNMTGQLSANRLCLCSNSCCCLLFQNHILNPKLWWLASWGSCMWKLTERCGCCSSLEITASWTTLLGCHSAAMTWVCEDDHSYPPTAVRPVKGRTRDDKHPYLSCRATPNSRDWADPWISQQGFPRPWRHRKPFTVSLYKLPCLFLLWYTVCQ